MASLPYHGRLFGARQTPLSRFQLNKRLAWLDPDDAQRLERIKKQLRWRRRLLLNTDEAFLIEAKRAVEETDIELLADILRARLEARTLIAALRMRAKGHGPPGEKEPWGYGRWLNVMRNHWTQPDFGVGHIHPWIIKAEKRMRAGDTLGLERVFMNQAWGHLSRAGAGHYFDFEAVAVYVLRWDLVDRWTRYEAEAAQERITSLANSGLGKFEKMYH